MTKKTDAKRHENEFTLPSGAICQMKPVKGKHIRNAGRVAGMEVSDNPSLLSLALVTQVITVDGKPVTMEALDEMSGADVMKLQAKAMGKLT